MESAQKLFAKMYEAQDHSRVELQEQARIWEAHPRAELQAAMKPDMVMM